MKPKFTVIGCGRLGKTLAFLWKMADLISVQNIYNTSVESAKSAVAFIGEGEVCQTIAELQPSNIYLIAAPDDKIEALCQQLAKQAKFNAGNLVFHCSGLHTSDCLDAAKSLGCYTASLHPIFSFSDPINDVHHFAGTYCSFEGSLQAFDQISTLVQGIGGQLFQIAKAQKGLYHVASVFASTYLVTLSIIAEACYRKAGLSDELSKPLTHRLMQQSLHSIKRSPSMKDALTGPIQRGDSNAIQQHINTLQPFTDLQGIYKSLGKVALETVDHTSEMQELLKTLFS